MIDCQTYLERYSAYLDHDVSWAEREEMEAHADLCESCAEYDRVVRRGTDVLRGLPEIEVSEDFGERLQWRLYQEDYEARRERGMARPAQALGTVAIAALIAVAAWVPLMRPRPAVAHLPAVAVEGPPRQGLLLRRLLAHPPHQEATGLTSRLAELGVRVREMPYHEVVFGAQQGPLAGSVAVTGPQPVAAGIQP
ncbi:MAG TPA: zf-HC2 domain-containing protein [Longimicrobium sp.]|nr:zf-HC2 domain-containing protein [Longimicrobium sp.]